MQLVPLSLACVQEAGYKGVMNMIKQKGITLIELMLGIAIFAITVSFAVPNLREFLANNKIIATTNDFVSTLLSARAEAVKQRRTVTVCGSTNGTSCNSTLWQNGWIAFIDADVDNQVTAGDEIFVVKNQANSGVTISSAYFANAGWIQYTSRGVIDSTGSFKICDQRGVTFAKAININVTGRTRLATDDNASGVFNDSGGGDLTCP